MAKLGKRGEKLKENYRRLRDAGFSSAEATRFRGSSEAEIQKAISRKALPELREEKRGAVKIKVQKKEYKTSELWSIEIQGTTDTYLKKVLEQFRKMDRDGFNYYSVRTRIKFNTGEEEVFTTPMSLTKSVTNLDMLTDVITNDIEEIIERYNIADADRRIVSIKIEILFWRVKAQGK